MQTQYLHWFLLALVSASIALLAASCAYCALRALEKWNTDLAVLLNITALLIVLVLLAVFASLLFLHVLVPISLTALCGFNFHQKSGGASRSPGQAVLFMMVVTFMTVGIQIGLWLTLGRLISGLLDAMGSFSYSIGYFFYFLYYAPIALVPFLLWLFQTSRLRPGIDRHLEANEQEPPHPSD